MTMLDGFHFHCGFLLVLKKKNKNKNKKKNLKKLFFPIIQTRNSDCNQKNSNKIHGDSENLLEIILVVAGGYFSLPFKASLYSFPLLIFSQQNKYECGKRLL
jgi:hypothetical protein